MTLQAARMILLLLVVGTALKAQDVYDRVEHHYADSDGVRIHYVSLGDGPLVVMIHGFPDFWYTWRDQIEALSDQYTVVALDQRGYNRSDKPEGVENYAMSLLMSDVAAVIRDQGQESATIIGHDWGGAVAWSLAMYRPELVERLVILNLPHLRGLARELATNPEQQRNSQYARDFQQPDFHEKLTAEGLSMWVADEAARPRYVEAFQRSSFESMLNFYKQNYPREPYTLPDGDVPLVKCSVLMLHGLDDQALLPAALNGTWEWVEKDLTIVTVPGAGHFVQQDASTFVTNTMRTWLARPAVD